MDGNFPVRLSGLLPDSAAWRSWKQRHVYMAWSYMRLYGISANKSTVPNLDLDCLAVLRFCLSVAVKGSFLLDAGDSSFKSWHFDGAGHFSNRDLRCTCHVSDDFSSGDIQNLV